MSFYTDAQRTMQEEFDSTRLAGAMEAAIIRDKLDDAQVEFIRSRDFFFLTSVNAAGEPTVSFKGGGVGTVTVIDERTLAFPIYDGNGMFLSAGNIAETAKIGLLFIDFETPHRVRVQATASIDPNDDLMSSYPGALLVVRAAIDSAFVNCARYIHKHQRLETSRYVPDADGDQPLATWKRIEGLTDSLRDGDAARVEESGGTISGEDYNDALRRGES